MPTIPGTPGFINSLDPNSPINDNFVYGADDWVRFLQDVIKTNQFPISEDGSSNGWDIALTVKASEVNSLEGASSSATMQEQLDAITSRLDAIDAESVPIGSLVPWPVSEVPPSQYLSTDPDKPGIGEWWICDGSNIDGTTYTDIFSRIGNTYGGTDAASMLLPDIQGRIIAGRSNGTSRLTGYRQGAVDTAQGNVGGEESHTPVAGEMYTHNHGGGDHPHSIDVFNTPGSEPCVPGSPSTANPGGSPSVDNSGTIINTEGSSEKFNVTQPTIIMAMYIRVL